MSLEEKKIVLKQVLKERWKAALLPVWVYVFFLLMKLIGATEVSWWVGLVPPAFVAVVEGAIVLEVWLLVKAKEAEEEVKS